MGGAYTTNSSYDHLKTSYKSHLDVNECLSNSTCDANARCNNTEGSYTCTCDSGYSGDGLSCDGMHRTEIVITITIRRTIYQLQKKCNYRHSGWSQSCDLTMTVQRYNQLSYRVTVVKL